MSMQIPPLLAAVAAEYIGEQIETKVGEITVATAADELLKWCTRFP